jgi:hypothetical protein
MGAICHLGEPTPKLFKTYLKIELGMEEFGFIGLPRPSLPSLSGSKLSL